MERIFPYKNTLHAMRTKGCGILTFIVLGRQHTFYALRHLLSSAGFAPTTNLSYPGKRVKK